MRSVYFAGFDALPRDYHALFAERPGLTFDQSLPWLSRLATLLTAEGGSVTIVGLEDGGAPVLALPLIKAPSSGLSADADVHAVANYYTAYFGPVLDPSRAAADLAAPLTSAIAALPTGWQVLDLNPVDLDGSLMAGVADGLRRSGAAVEKYFRFGNWYQPVGGQTYEQYHRERPSQLRETVRRRRKKLEKEKSCEFRIVTEPADVDAAMDGYESIYSKSWKQAEPHADFIRGVAREFAARGWLRLGSVLVDGKPVAAQLWYVFGGTASIFKLAYDPDYQQYSVGSLLTSHLMERAIDVDRVDTIDYLCGDDSYKKDWMSHRRERWGLRAYRLASVRGFVGAARSVVGRTVKRFRAKPTVTKEPA